MRARWDVPDAIAMEAVRNDSIFDMLLYQTPEALRPVSGVTGIGK